MLDNTAKKKYIKWAGKYREDVWPTIELFHNNRSKFKYKDIYKYSLDEILKEIKDKNISSKRQMKYDGSEKIFTDSEKCNYSIIRIDTFEACKKYFSNTKLCITDRREFFSYLSSGHPLVFYCVVKEYICGAQKRKYKECIVAHLFGAKFAYSIYDQDDNEVEPIFITHGDERIYEQIESDLRSRGNNIYAQLKYKTDNDTFLKFISESNGELFGRRSYDLQVIKNHPRIAIEKIPKLCGKLSKKTLIDNIDLINAQKILAEIWGSKHIHKLSIKNDDIKRILLRRAEHNKSIRNECIRLGLIEKPKTPKNKKTKNLKNQMLETEVSLLRKEVAKLKEQLKKR